MFMAKAKDVTKLVSDDVFPWPIVAAASERRVVGQHVTDIARIIRKKRTCQILDIDVNRIDIKSHRIVGGSAVCVLRSDVSKFYVCKFSLTIFGGSDNRLFHGGFIGAKTRAHAIGQVQALGCIPFHVGTTVGIDRRRATARSLPKFAQLLFGGVCQIAAHDVHHRPKALCTFEL